MLKKLYTTCRRLVGRALRWLRRLLVQKYRPYSGQHPKQLALCVPKGFSLGFPLEDIGHMCSIVEYEPSAGTWYLSGTEVNFEAVCAEYEYLWFVPEGYPVTRDMVYGLLLKFCKTRVDFVLLSWTLKDMPEVAVLPEPWANVVLASERVIGWQMAEFSGAYGHVQRLFCVPEDCFDVMKTESFFAERLNVTESPFYNHREVIFSGGVKRDRSSQQQFALCPARDPQKPMILVLPAFLMVGGVERNTLGVMEELQERYDFLMVVFGGLTEKNGSMHYQMRRCTTALYDFSELLDYGQYIDALADLRDTYRPDVVWICNGSDWICDNAMNLRRTFPQTPIVDQEVYDVNEGWISRYREKGIQSFDRFIAINRKIYDRFIGEFQIPPERIDIIYSVVNLNILSSERQLNPAEMRRKYEIPEGKRIFAFIGRLTKQKRPLLLVRLFAEINKQDPACHFMIIGNGEMKEEVRALTDVLDVKNVTMVDFVDNLSEVYCFLDGIVFVSAYEGLPIVVLEGLVKGVPTISTDVGDVRLVLEDYGAGAIFSNGFSEDPVVMAQDFQLFCGNLDRYRAAIAAHAEDIRNRFSATTIAGEWDASFQKAISIKKGELSQ